ncbi:mycofactocin biosynthesis chaperone MftB [Phycicoccus sp. Soil802]|uniref:mycofactocin biosynthesis chaperone MftB n=1 Tax=Phycicoccus sp. Soil802 TaxID=1736414 RepID=UPI00070381C4|nr:mycofactocin biosynthesis chaperone MftB [Phycicoccus sp. Soil802]KRF22421.1 mycofactocin system protein MftB [Phycicoccus sp. Soil802]
MEDGTILDDAWTLSASVALRPEPFGALAYHFGTRTLTFLKTPQLVQVVRLLADQTCARSAMVAAGVDPKQHATYAAALAGLEHAGVVQRRAKEAAA